MRTCRRHLCRLSLAVLLAACVLAPKVSAKDWAAFVEARCLNCHDSETAKGEIVLDAFEPDLTRYATASLWNRVLDQVAFGEMPPKNKKQPTGEERAAFVMALESALTKAGHRPDLAAKMRQPEYGNYVEHQALFDGSVKASAFTPARLWLRNPFTYDRLIDDGAGFTKPGRYGHRSAHLSKIKQPFTLEERAGIMDYAALTLADSATLDTVMRNAGVMADKFLGEAMHAAYVREHGEIPEDQLPKDKKGKPIRPRFPKTPELLSEIILSKEPPTEAQVNATIELLYGNIVQRKPMPVDVKKYRALIQDSIAEAGNAEGLRLGLIAIAISPAAIYRAELGQGEPDARGRRMLAPVDLAFAISWALTDRKPDATLLATAQEGRLQTRTDVAREVTRIWDDPEIEKPRILRFFHEFFGYHKAPGVFKDQARFGADYRNVPKLLVQDADTLVMHIVREDRDVFKRLLTTPEYFVAHSGDNADERVVHNALQGLYDYYKDKGWRKFEYKMDPEHMKHVRSLHRMFNHANGSVTKRWMNYLEHCAKNGLSHMPMAGGREYILAYNLHEKRWSYPVEQPFALDPKNRIGILMHPAWLLAHSLNLDNDPVRRGLWIRKRLLAGTVPELPITVDASIPEDPHRTLRERFTKISGNTYCWRCHERMNPLGMTLESFDDFGRHRRGTEKLHAKGKTRPVDATGLLEGTGVEALDGEVASPVELIQRVAKSDRARQSFVRHAFRYWMGRNELLTDSQTLIQADKAYLENDGSFRSLVLSLLTSDSFLYRKH